MLCLCLRFFYSNFFLFYFFRFFLLSLFFAAAHVCVGKRTLWQINFSPFNNIKSWTFTFQRSFILIIAPLCMSRKIRPTEMYIKCVAKPSEKRERERSKKIERERKSNIIYHQRIYNRQNEKKYKTNTCRNKKGKVCDVVFMNCFQLYAFSYWQSGTRFVPFFTIRNTTSLLSRYIYIYIYIFSHKAAVVCFFLVSVFCF